MRIALIITLGACYYLSWLPPSFVVPALMAVSLLRSRTGGRIPRRGGYIVPPSSASAGASQGTAARVQTYTDFSRAPGLPSEVRTAFTVPLGASRTIEPGSYMSEWGFAPGRLTTDAEPVSAKLMQRFQDTGVPPWAPPGDCGCGDTAA